LFDEFSYFVGDFFCSVGQEKKQIDVAAGVQGPTTVSASSDEGDGVFALFFQS